MQFSLVCLIMTVRNIAWP